MKKKLFGRGGDKLFSGKKKGGAFKHQKKEQVLQRCAFCKQVVEEASSAVFLSGVTLHQGCVVQFRRVAKGEKAGAKPKATSPIEQYDLQAALGTGGFATVWKAEEKHTGNVFAIKVIKKKGLNEASMLQVTREREIMAKVRSGPYLACSLRDFEDDDNVYIVMECADGGDLFDTIQAMEHGLGVEMTRSLASQILLGLEFLHFIGIVYRDLKPENILLTSTGRVLLTDFGISKDGLHTEAARTSTFCGTSIYLAPEVLLGKPYGRAVDWWSFGCVVFEMLSGMPPFYSEDIGQMTRAILKSEPDYPDAWDDELVVLLQGLLTKTPDDRLQDADTVRDSAFFAGVNWEELLAGGKLNPELVAIMRQADEEIDTGGAGAGATHDDDAFADFDYDAEAEPGEEEEDVHDEQEGESVRGASPADDNGDASDLLQVTAFESWEGDESEEMSIHQGDVITVTEQMPDGWWKGETGGRQGYFPSSFVS